MRTWAALVAFSGGTFGEIVDEFGNLFIFRIEQTDDEDSDNDKPLLTEMLLQVMASQKDSNLDEHRLLW